MAAVAADVVWRVPYLRSHLLINKPLWLSLFLWIQSILFPVEMIVSVVDFSDYQVTISQSGYYGPISHTVLALNFCYSPSSSGNVTSRLFIRIDHQVPVWQSLGRLCSVSHPRLRVPRRDRCRARCNRPMASVSFSGPATDSSGLILDYHWSLLCRQR